MKPFEYQQPTSIESALALSNDTANYIAGGTNQVDLMKKHINEPDAVIDVNAALPSAITPGQNGIEIGALVSNSALADDAVIKEKYPLISEAILAGASPQIRNMATTAGNLMQRTRCPYFYDTTLPCNKRQPGSGCGALEGNSEGGAIVGHSEHCVAVHPSDLCIALVALDAKVRIIRKDGQTNTIAFSNFHRLPEDTPQFDNNLPEGSLITSVFVPENKLHQNFSYLKIRERTEYAFALVSVAAALELDENGYITTARLASGGVAHKPWRWKEAEAYLTGQQALTSHFRQAAAICADQAEPLKDNGYKVTLLQGAVETALTKCLEA